MSDAPASRAGEPASRRPARRRALRGRRAAPLPRPQHVVARLTQPRAERGPHLAGVEHADGETRAVHRRHAMRRRSRARTVNAECFRETGQYHRRDGSGIGSVRGRSAVRARTDPRHGIRAVQPARHPRGRGRPDHRRVRHREDDALPQLPLEGRARSSRSSSAREELWTRAWLQAEAQRRGRRRPSACSRSSTSSASGFSQEDFEGCSFINVMLEIDDRDEPGPRRPRSATSPTSATFVARPRRGGGHRRTPTRSRASGTSS